MRHFYAWCSVAALLLCALSRIPWGGLDHDAVAHLHLAWHVHQGHVPLLDVFDHHSPLFYYLLAPLHALSDDPPTLVVLGRAVNGVVLILIVAVTWHLGRRLMGEGTALMGLVLLLLDPWRLESVCEVRPEPLQCLLVAGALASIVDARQSSLRCLVSAGILMGLSCAVVHSSIVVAIALVPAIVWWRRQETPTAGVVTRATALSGGWSAALLSYAAGFIGTIALFAMWLRSIGALQPYFTLVLCYNTLLYGHLRLTPHIFFHFFFLSGPLTWTFGIVGLVLPGVAREVRLLLHVPVIVSLVVLLGMRAPYPQHYLIVWPPMALVAAQTFIRLLALGATWGGRALRRSLVAIAWAAVLYGTLPRMVSHYGLREDSGWKWFERVSREIVRSTGPSDCVFDPEFDANITRPDIGYYWLGAAHYYDALSRLLGKRIAGPGPDDLRRSRPRYVVDTLMSPALRDYVDRHYRPTRFRRLLVAVSPTDDAPRQSALDALNSSHASPAVPVARRSGRPAGRSSP